MYLGIRKIDNESATSGNIRPEGLPDEFLGGGITEGAQRLELRFYKFLLLVLHAVPPPTGAADPRHPVSPADPSQTKCFFVVVFASVSKK